MEPRNQATVVNSEKESEPMKTSLAVEAMTSQVQLVPNNQVGGTSSLPPRTPIPPESLKCNILKATLEQGKNSNLVSITSTDGPGITAKKNQHAADAATIVSVVSVANFCLIFLVSCPLLYIYIFIFVFLCVYSICASLLKFYIFFSLFYSMFYNSFSKI